MNKRLIGVILVCAFIIPGCASTKVNLMHLEPSTTVSGSDGSIDRLESGAILRHQQFGDIHVTASAVTDEEKKTSLVLVLHVDNQTAGNINVYHRDIAMLDGNNSVMTPLNVVDTVNTMNRNADMLVANHIARQSLASSYAEGSVGRGIKSAGASIALAIVQRAANKVKQDAQRMYQEAFREGAIPPGANRVGKIYYPQPVKYPVTTIIKVEGHEYKFSFNEKSQ